MGSYRDSERIVSQLNDLKRLYGTKTRAIDEAVERLHEFHFPEKHPEPPHITGWKPYVVREPTRCSETGLELAFGAQAYQEVWSDGRPGDIVSREALVADGVLPF